MFSHREHLHSPVRRRGYQRNFRPYLHIAVRIRTQNNPTLAIITRDNIARLWRTAEITSCGLLYLGGLGVPHSAAWERTNGGYDSCADRGSNAIANQNGSPFHTW